MTVQFYLIVGSGGSVKAVKSYRNLAWNEVAIHMTVAVPDRIFQKPSLSASVTIPDEVAGLPEISAEVKDNVREAIEAATGMEVLIRVENPNSGR